MIIKLMDIALSIVIVMSILEYIKYKKLSKVLYIVISMVAIILTSPLSKHISETLTLTIGVLTLALAFTSIFLRIKEVKR